MWTHGVRCDTFNTRRNSVSDFSLKTSLTQQIIGLGWECSVCDWISKGTICRICISNKQSPAKTGGLEPAMGAAHWEISQSKIARGMKMEFKSNIIRFPFVLLRVSLKQLQELDAVRCPSSNSPGEIIMHLNGRLIMKFRCDQKPHALRLHWK